MILIIFLFTSFLFHITSHYSLKKKENSRRPRIEFNCVGSREPHNHLIRINLVQESPSPFDGSRGLIIRFETFEMLNKLEARTNLLDRPENINKKGGNPEE